MDTTAENSFSTPTSTSAGASNMPPYPAKAGPNTGAPDLLQRVVNGAHDTIDRLAETAAPHVQRLQEGMSSAGDTLQQRSDQALEIGDEWAESLRTTVRDHPLAAVATAVAVGMLVARITR